MNIEQKKIKNMPKQIVLLFSLFICSCDLFNGPIQPDYLGNIDDEIRWANAAKLTVRIEYPPAWGVSNPSAGQIAPTPMDIRQGYAFDLEFTPDASYTLQGWRAYDTSVLNALGDWRLDTSLLNGVPQLSGVEFPELPARGGKGNITINTVTPVTLVPWCKTEPYVIRTEPRTELRDSATMRVYNPLSSVTVYFNAALDPDMVWGLQPGMVEIEARPISSITADGPFNTNCNGWFDRVEYSSRGGEYTLTIYPSVSGPVPEHQIKVTIGPGIRNAQGEFMEAPEVIYYKVSKLENTDAEISGWSAAYNTGSITVSCNIGGKDAASATIKAYYQMNRGSSQQFLEGSGVNHTGTIYGVSSPDSSGVIQGRMTSNIQEYRILIELYVAGVLVQTEEFKIWNFPGMKVNKNATADNEKEAIEIRTATDLPTTASGLGRQYVLANDITVTGHNPIGTAATPFQGKFYGNGHTVTISGFNANASGSVGLFGVTGDGVLIRDLTVEYNNVTFSHTNSLNFGGILGSPNGAVQLINVLTKGAVTINGSNSGSVTNDISVGGIIGYVNFSNSTGKPEASINNAHMGLNLSVKNNGTVSTDKTGNSLNIGGIGGLLRTYYENNVNNGIMRIENVTVVGNITVGDTANRVIVLELNVGGLVGYWGGVSVANLDFKGELTAWCGNGTLRLGGAVGYISSSNGNDIYNCVIMQKGIEVTKTGSGDIYIGGFLGEYMGYEDLKNCYCEGPVVVNAQGGTKAVGGFVGKISGQVLYCYSKGDVKVSSTGGDVYAGGFCGWQSISAGVGVTFAIQYSYAMGNVNATGRGTFHAGGFAGMVERTVNDCYSTGNVFVDSTGADDIMAGGLIGYASLFQSYQAPENSFPFFHCFATGAVAAHRNGNATTSAGGLVGAHRPSNSVYITTTIRDCAALGVSVTVTGAGTRNIGRLYGNDYPATRFVLTKNRAFSDMGLYQSGTYKSANPTPQVPASDHENIDGADVSFSGIRYIDFWKNSTPDSGPTLATHGLGFSDADWIFTTVGYFGYPILRVSKNGPAMGGQ